MGDRGAAPRPSGAGGHARGPRGLTVARSAIVAQASRALAEARDEVAIVRALTRIVVPALGAACVVDTIEGDDTVRRVGHARSPRAAREIGRRDPFDPDGPHLLGRMLRGGRAELLPDFLAVPLVARDRMLGVLAVLARAPRRFGPRDLALARDLAWRAAVALDNARLAREARAASSARDELLATLSHELRNAMNAILGWAQILRTIDLREALAGRALDTIERQTRLQAQLIGNLFDVSRIASGKLAVEVEPVDLRPIVEAVVADSHPAAGTRGLRLLTTLAPARVRGDAARLHQVVQNLVANALKFTEAGGWVDVRLAHVGPDVELRVADSGRGIDPALLPHIFDRFRQGGGPHVAGLGLGLAIVRAIVDLHHGTVRAESEGLGKGAALIVTLPRLPG